jgi:HEPN domain-containing protein
MEQWQIQLKQEFERAAQAREKKNEGQARVCARRAAGIAIREYFVRRGIRPPNTSAYDLLNLLKHEPLLPANMKLVTDHLTVRVTEEFKLPVEADLVVEARLLCKWLLPEWE